jgi:hypothetical protein
MAQGQKLIFHTEIPYINLFKRQGIYASGYASLE